MKGGQTVGRCVTCTLQHEGQFYVAETVPARVDEESGGQYFGPSTVERLQEVTPVSGSRIVASKRRYTNTAREPHNTPLQPTPTSGRV